MMAGGKGRGGGGGNAFQTYQDFSSYEDEAVAPAAYPATNNGGFGGQGFCC